MEVSILDSYCSKWNLFSPSLLASTFTSQVYKVKFQGKDSVLKILNEKGKKFEVRAASVLRCFNGNGAVKLLAADDGAHLLEFIDGRQLKSIVAEGNDNQATGIICEVINSLHAYSGPVPGDLISMSRNFQGLFLRAPNEPRDSIYIAGAKLAEHLIATEQEIRVLHGDIHHENVMESSERGWLVIDPQCLAGERTYDLANTFYNPNGFLNLAESPEAIRSRCDIFSSQLKIDRKRILEYAFAYGCLSAAWSMEDGQDAGNTLRIAKSIHGLLRSDFS